MRLFFPDRIDAPLPQSRPRPKCNFIHPRQLSPSLEGLELPFSNEIWSGYEKVDPSGTDLFTAWVKMSEHETLVKHMVDVQKATAEIWEASEKKPATSSHKNSSNKHFATLRVCRGDSASTTGTLDKFQKGGISFPLTTSTATFSRIASTCPIDPK